MNAISRLFDNTVLVGLPTPATAVVIEAPEEDILRIGPLWAPVPLRYTMVVTLPIAYDISHYPVMKAVFGDRLTTISAVSNHARIGSALVDEGIVGAQVHQIILMHDLTSDAYTSNNRMLLLYTLYLVAFLIYLIHSGVKYYIESP
jgi:hypothetical protein